MVYGHEASEHGMYKVWLPGDSFEGTIQIKFRLSWSARSQIGGRWQQTPNQQESTHFL